MCLLLHEVKLYKPYNREQSIIVSGTRSPSYVSEPTCALGVLISLFRATWCLPEFSFCKSTHRSTCACGNQVLQDLITYEYYIRSSISTDVLPKSDVVVAKIKQFSVQYSSTRRNESCCPSTAQVYLGKQRTWQKLHVASWY